MRMLGGLVHGGRDKRDRDEGYDSPIAHFPEVAMAAISRRSRMLLGSFTLRRNTYDLMWRYRYWVGR